LGEHGPTEEWLIHGLSFLVVLWCTLNILSIDESENLRAALFSVTVLDEVAGEGINEQFHLRDSLSVRIGSQRDSPNIAFLINPYSFEWPMSEKAIGTESDATQHRPRAEL
jgi:hypothetical protein